MNIESIGKRFFAFIIDILIATGIFRIFLIISLALLGGVYDIDFFGRLAMITMLSFIYPPQILIIPVILYNSNYSYFYCYVFLLIYLIVFEIIYYIIMQINFERTIGQKYMKIKVKRHDGTKLTFFRALLRALLKTISNYLFFIPYTMLLFTKNQTLHDKVSGSIVVEHNG